jgi:HSP20 family protein
MGIHGPQDRQQTHQLGDTNMTMMFPDPYDSPSNLQRTLDAFMRSNWLQSSLSGGGGYPPINVFRKGDDFMLIAELPGVEKSNINVQIRGNAIRIAGAKSLDYDKSASVHRRERLAGEFDRTVALPVEIDADKVRAECRDGILALLLPRAERDKPKSIELT